MAKVTLPLLLMSLSTAVLTAAEREAYAMGTTLVVQVSGAGAAQLEPLVAEVEGLEARVSSWRPGTVFFRLNSGDGQRVPLAPDLLGLLERVKALSRDTGGAFSPTLLPLVQAWGLRSGGRTPTPAEREAALRLCAPDRLRVEAGSAWFDGAGGGIDEGGFLKGEALERLAVRAKGLGLASGWADFGGQIIAWGEPREVEVALPSRRQVPMLRLTLANASLSVSGCSERGRHILDPRTGEPSPDWGAVAVVAPDGLVADALSTALFVLGPKAGAAWARSHGVAAAFLPHRGAPTFTPAFCALNPTSLNPLESR